MGPMEVSPVLDFDFPVRSNIFAPCITRLGVPFPRVNILNEL